MSEPPAENWEALDWEALQRLRAGFLGGTAGQADYWTSDAALDSYDRTFGQRIAWKWRLVLRELQRLAWSPPEGEVLDWGCGSGVAGREFVTAFPRPEGTTLALHDRSARACAFAAGRARAALPGLRVRETSAPGAAPATLLLSHVLGELAAPALDELVALAAVATTVVWVEPGTHEVSRRLIAVRERLRSSFRVVAPCTHQQTCGMLVDGNERHWCHHFAEPPAGVFTDGGWARFGRLAGIDLRSLPLSYLMLDRRPGPALPDDAVRLIGRPRVYKGRAVLFGCDASGVAGRELQRRDFPDAFKEARKGRLDTLKTWTCRGGRVQALEPLKPQPPAEARS